MERTVSRYWCEAGTNSIGVTLAYKHGRMEGPDTQEDSGINWQIAADANAPHGDERTKGNVIGRAPSGDGEHSDDKQRDVERPPKNNPCEHPRPFKYVAPDPPAAPDIRPNAPEDRTDQEPDVLLVR